MYRERGREIYEDNTNIWAKELISNTKSANEHDIHIIHMCSKEIQQKSLKSKIQEVTE